MNSHDLLLRCFRDPIFAEVSGLDGITFIIIIIVVVIIIVIIIIACCCNGCVFRAWTVLFGARARACVCVRHCAGWLLSALGFDAVRFIQPFDGDLPAKFAGRIREACAKFAGNFREACAKFTGNFREACAKFAGNWRALRSCAAPSVAARRPRRLRLRAAGRRPAARFRRGGWGEGGVSFRFAAAAAGAGGGLTIIK